MQKLQWFLYLKTMRRTAIYYDNLFDGWNGVICFASLSEQRIFAPYRWRAPLKSEANWDINSVFIIYFLSKIFLNEPALIWL